MKKSRFLIIALFFIVSISIPSAAAENVTIIYQNDLHGWLFPSSTRVGMIEMARILTPLFENNHNSFYAMSGDLFTGPNLPDEMKGVSELNSNSNVLDSMSYFRDAGIALNEKD